MLYHPQQKYLYSYEYASYLFSSMIGPFCHIILKSIMFLAGASYNFFFLKLFSGTQFLVLLSLNAILVNFANYWGLISIYSSDHPPTIRNTELDTRLDPHSQGRFTEKQQEQLRAITGQGTKDITCWGWTKVQEQCQVESQWSLWSLLDQRQE